MLAQRLRKPSHQSSVCNISWRGDFLVDGLLYHALVLKVKGKNGKFVKILIINNGNQLTMLHE